MLTDDGCTYAGDKTVPAGPAGRFTIDVENQTGHGGNFAPLRLAKGFTADNIKPFLAQESAWERTLSEADIWNMNHGKPPRHQRPALPQLFNYKWGAATEVEGGASSVLPIDVPAGSYAVLCRIVDLGAQEEYVAAPIKARGPTYGVTTP